MADVDLIREIRFSGLRPYVEEIWGWDPEEQEQRFLANFSLERNQIIRHDGKDVGVLEMEERDRFLCLTIVCIAEPSRSKGLGEAVVRGVLELGEELEKPVRLRVLRNNPAQRFYERLGFKVVEASGTHLTMEAGK